MSNLVPARYTADHLVSLPSHITFYNLDGTKRASKTLSKGDELMMPDREILGQSYLHTGDGQMLILGAGRVVLPEHAMLSSDDLLASGYEFHDGRSDFELVIPEMIKGVA